MHENDHIERKLDTISAQLFQLLLLIAKQGTSIMSALDDLTAQVAAAVTVEQSAIVLLGQLHDLLVAAGTDPVKLAALTKSLEDQGGLLAAAITANTPAATP